MTFGRSSVLTLALVTLALGACGSDSGSDAGSGSGRRAPPTELAVKGAATEGDGTTPDATEVDITGTIRCDEDGATGTGVYEDTAVDICSQMSKHQRGFSRRSRTKIRTAGCAPRSTAVRQHATITGTVDGQPVDIDVQRTDGCGIDDWQSLEWLLGPPER